MNSQLRLIALSGKMGVGKSEAIKTLSGILNKPLHLVKFAQPLYDIQEYSYNRISSVYKRPESFIKDRPFLQWVGTDWGRNIISETLWVDLWKAEVNEILQHDPEAFIVCDDCRFDNEAETVKAAGGKIILITSNRTEYRINTNGSSHASEVGINTVLVDGTVTNNGTLEEYKTLLTSTFYSLGL